MRRLAAIALGLWVTCSFLLTGWTLSQNPFAAPLIDRTTDEARLAIARAIASEVTVDWLTPRLHDAVAADDIDRVTMFLELADDYHLTLAAADTADANAVIASHTGVLNTVADCGKCAVDVAACESIKLIAACSIPFELSPAGDVSALSRAGFNWVTGSDIDEIEAGLAAIGLGATVATVASGGASATMKVGATMLRVGRKIGAIHPAMLDAIRRAVTHADDEAKLADMVADFGKLRTSTSTAEALVLLKVAETPDDLRRVVRVSEAAGPKTRKAFEVLGKARTFRLLSRVSHLALAAIGLMTLVATQLMSGVLVLLRWVLHPLTRDRRPGRNMA